MSIFRFSSKLLVNARKLTSHAPRYLTKRPFHSLCSRTFANPENKNPTKQNARQHLPAVRSIITTPRFNKQLPDLIYVPHVFRWLRTKFKFKYLQRTWDPEFSEGAFIYGTTQAVCRITEIINQNRPEDLQGLVTNSTKSKISFDMRKKLTKIQRKIIKLTPKDIKILVPISVSMVESPYDRLCRIKLRVLALKWYDFNKSLSRLVLVALQTEFMRNYSDGAKPEWTISNFDILECSALSEKPKP